MLSSASDKCAKQQKGKKSAKKRKKCFVGDGRSRDLLVVDEETGSRLKEVLTHVVRDLLPKDPATDVQSDERVAGEEDERTEEKKRGDRNNQLGKKMHEVKKHFVLGVNEIVKSISRSSAIAVLLTDPLETHLQLQLQQLASHHSVPCLCVPGFDETLKSLQVPSMVGIAVRPTAADPSSIVHPLLCCIKTAAAGEADSPPPTFPLTRPVCKLTYALQFRDLRRDQLYSMSDLVKKEVSGSRHDETSASNENDVIAVTGAKDNFFPCRTAMTSSPFVVSHSIQPPVGSDRDNAFMTRFGFTGSNMDQGRTPSSTADDGEEEKGVKFRQMTYRPADSLIVQPSGKKRIRHKKMAKKQGK